MGIKKKPIKKKKVKKKIIREAVPAPRLTAQDKRWRAEDDARILATAEDIKKDKARLGSAKTQAARMALEQEKNLASIKKIANQKK